MPRPERTESSRRSRGHAPHENVTSPRRSGEGNNHCYKSRSRYASSPRRSPLSGRCDATHDCTHKAEKFKTLCVKNFSTKVSIDAIQEYLFRDFERFGDVAISVGHLDGELAALISFKYSEDAWEAYHAKPTVFLHDRTVAVEPLPEGAEDNQPRGKIRRTTGYHSSSVVTANNFNRRFPPPPSTPGALETNIAGLLAKSAAAGLVPPGGPPGLLGLPGLAPSAMMAAAARALGLTTGAPTPLPPPPTILPSVTQAPPIHETLIVPSHNRRAQSGNVDEIESNSTRTLFVGGLETDITEQEVQKSFEIYGYIEHIDIKRSSKPGIYSYAFIRYENVDMACRAKAAMSGQCVRSLNCKIGYGKAIPSPCLYIGALGSWITPEIFHKLLTRFGTVVQLDWPTGRSHAHIMFETTEAAFAANSQLKGLPINNRSRRRLRVDFIDPEVMQFSNAGRKVKAAVESSPVAQSLQCHSNLLADSGHVYPVEHGGSSTRSGTNSIRQRSEALGCNRSTWPNKQSAVSDQRKHTVKGGPRRSGEIEQSLSFTDASHASLSTVVSLSDLDRCLQPELFTGRLQLKSNHFDFRCLFVTGDSNIGHTLRGLNDNIFPRAAFRVSRRGRLDPSWMAEATHRIYDVLYAKSLGLSLFLILPYRNQQLQTKKSLTLDNENNTLPLEILIAYLKMKQAIAVLEPEVDKCNSDQETKDDEKHSFENDKKLLIRLLVPSSFALSLLKQAAPQLTSQMATMDNYMVLLAINPNL